MTTPILSTIWVRIAIFLWGIVFPIVFVALPLMKVATGDAEFEMSTLWAFLVWVLSPLAAAVVMKYLGRDDEPMK